MVWRQGDHAVGAGRRRGLAAADLLVRRDSAGDRCVSSRSGEGHGVGVHGRDTAHLSAVVLLAWSLLGPQVTLALVAAALVGAMAIGLVDNYLRGGHEADGTKLAEDSGESCCDVSGGNCDTPGHDAGEAKAGWLERTGRALRWALADFGPQVSVDMFLGLCVAAVMLALVPADAISGWVGGGSILSLFAVVLVALPLYTCTLPTIPVVAGLLSLGMGSGAGVALLIAGPATNLGEINAMRRQMGGRTALYFAIGLIVTGVAAGAAVNAIATAEAETGQTSFDTSVFAEHSADESLLHMLQEVSVWQWPFLIVIVGVLAVGLAQRVAKWPEKLRRGPSLKAWLFGRV